MEKGAGGGALVRRGAPVPLNEEARLADLRRLDLSAGRADLAFQGIVEMAAMVCKTAIGQISLPEHEHEKERTLTSNGTYKEVFKARGSGSRCRWLRV